MSILFSLILKSIQLCQSSSVFSSGYLFEVERKWGGLEAKWSTQSTSDLKEKWVPAAPAVLWQDIDNLITTRRFCACCENLGPKLAFAGKANWTLHTHLEKCGEVLDKVRLYSGKTKLEMGNWYDAIPARWTLIVSFDSKRFVQKRGCSLPAKWT